MKRNPLSLIALFAIAILLGQGCATSNISLEVPKPADISLPPEIETIALVNRFKPEKGKGFLNVLEGALSGENIGQDRNGAEASLDCSEAVPVVIVYKDKSGFALDYEVTSEVGTGNKAVTNTIALLNGKSAKPLKGKSLAKGHGRHLKHGKNVDIFHQGNSDLSFGADGPGEVVLVQVELDNGDGRKVFRSPNQSRKSAERKKKLVFSHRLRSRDDLGQGRLRRLRRRSRSRSRPRCCGQRRNPKKK